MDASTTIPELTLTRTLTASRDRIFSALTNADQIAQWWGPHGFTAPVCRADARAGGELYIEMRGPAGSPWDEPAPMFGTFLEARSPEKVVFTGGLKNAAGAFFLENKNSITLTENNGQTTLVLHVRVLHAGEGSADPLAGMTEGWNQTIERLAAFVQTP